MAEIKPKVMLGDPVTRTTGSTSSVNEMPTTDEKHPLAEAGQQATQTAGHLAERAADIGIHQADLRRRQAAEGIDHVAQGIRRVSTGLDQPAIADAAAAAADQVERLAQYLRDNDAREIIGKVEDAARRQPLLFLGGALVLGVAASRFLKAAAGANSSGDRSSEARASSASYRRANGYLATGPGSSPLTEGV